MKYVLLLAMGLFADMADAQVAMRPVSGEYLKTADVLWKKLVWRRIDLLEANNAAFRYRYDPAHKRVQFIEALAQAVMTNKISAYAPEDEDMSRPLDTAALHLQTDSLGQHVWSYHIKEVWMFDRNQGKMVVHILSITPEHMVDGHLKPVFVVKYADVYPYLEVPVPDADTTKPATYASLLETRMFTSRITKVGNLDAPAWIPNEEPHKPKKKKRKKDTADVMTDVWIY